MIRFLADENFDGPVLAGIRRKHPHVQIQSIQELGMSGMPDPDILEWATERNMVVLSRDLSTMPAYGYDRLRSGLTLYGLLLVHDRIARGTLIDQIAFWSQKERDTAFAYPIQYIFD